MKADDAVLITGTLDKDYNLISFVETSLSNVVRLQLFIDDATQSGDTELAEFFGKAQADSRKGDELAKGLPRARLG